MAGFLSCPLCSVVHCITALSAQLLLVTSKTQGFWVRLPQLATQTNLWDRGLSRFPIPTANTSWHCEIIVYNMFKRKQYWHDDVIKWKHFPRYWPFVRGIHRSPVNSLHKGPWRVALKFSLICVWINGWVNDREAGDLTRYPAHYDVTVEGSNKIRSGYNLFTYTCIPHSTTLFIKCLSDHFLKIRCIKWSD